MGHLACMQPFTQLLLGEALKCQVPKGGGSWVESGRPKINFSVAWSPIIFLLGALLFLVEP